MATEHFGTHRSGRILSLDEQTPNDIVDAAIEIADLRAEVAALNEVIAQQNITVSQFECYIEELEIVARDAIAQQAPVPTEREGWYTTDIHVYNEV
jgi:SMC interacting uncharacterized protein involved in chromosome segregation